METYDGSIMGVNNRAGERCGVYTLFLVEDEVIELDLLKEHIDWTSMEIRVVGSARNGRAAWEQIQALQPDIVLTDVKMPIMNGLELAMRISERFEWMKIVFLSGHDEFSFVKSALSAGAVGYLLKPVDPDELSGVIAKVKDEVKKADWLRRSKEIVADKQIREILRAGCGGSGSVEQAWGELTGMDPEYRDIEYVSALIEIDNRHALPPMLVQRLKEHDVVSEAIRSLLEAFSLEGAWIRQDAHRWFLAVRSRAGQEDAAFWPALSDAIREELGWTVTIGVCGKAFTLNQAGRIYEEAEKAVEQKFYAGPGLVIYSGEAREEGNEAQDASGLPTLPGSMTLSGLPQCEKEVGRYFERLTKLRVPREQVYRLSADLLKGISGELSKYEDWASMGNGEFSDWSREIARFESIAGIQAYVLGLLERINRFMEEKQQDRHTVLVQQVAEIIEREYSAALTIEDLAGRVYLSPNYLRALFKEKKGCTVHEYLTKIRLQKAVELLRDKKLKIHDVARQVGYDNTSYFCTFFYKSQGVTPNEYRKKYL